MANDYSDYTDYNPNPVPGLKTDLELLLSHFTNSKSVRYTEFAKIWCQMGFPTIFCGWGKEEALREMVETALRLTLAFWQDIYTFQVRMGGLYLMYAFYFSQPLDPPQKVRLTQSQWSAGRKLLETIQEQKHLDAEYIYHKLHFYKAFYYVMAPTPYQVAQTRRTNREIESTREQVPEDHQEPRSTSVQNVFPSALINNMESLHSHYRELKSQFISSNKSKKEGVKEAEGLHTLKEDFYDILKNGLKHMESWRPGSSSFDPDPVSKSTTAEVFTSPGQHGVNRRRLKEHAFERSGVMSRHQRHLVVDPSQSDSEKTFASPKKRPMKRKKPKSKETVQVSEDEVAKSSMPLCFEEDDVRGPEKDGGAEEKLKAASTDGDDQLGDALLRAIDHQSTLLPPPPPTSVDDVEDEVTLEDVKPKVTSKKGKRKRPTKSPRKSTTKSPTKSTTKLTTSPTKSPTESTTKSPTKLTSESPTKPLTESPSESPTESPSESPTESPTELPTELPTESPTKLPTESPTESPPS